MPRIALVWKRRLLGFDRVRLFSSPRASSSPNAKPNQKTIFLSNVYPDASASAAGVRTQSLLKHMTKWTSVHYATGSKEHESKESSNPQEMVGQLASKQISLSYLPPNRSDLLQDFFQEHAEIDTVVFDRFYIEEAYSFAFHERFPEAALVLDMQDVHSLRWGRQQVVQDFDKNYSKEDDPLVCLDSVLEYTPSVDNPHLLRELASIHRNDLTLVCSPYELDLLQTTYDIPKDKLCLASFFVKSSQLKIPQPRIPDEHPSFVFCGGFRHAPNVDAVSVLLRYAWPRIRQELPTATLHIHGAYCTQEIYQAHNPSNKGIYVHGFTPNLEDVFGNKNGNSSILLAPLRFGAGIKGKIVDAWTFGMPVVTTPIGGEGMTRNGNFGGSVDSTLDDFCTNAVKLAADTTAFDQAQQTGQRLLQELYDDEYNWNQVETCLLETKQNLTSRRQSDFTRAMLWHHQARSTEYFSRWIELKERNKRQEKSSSDE